jgi:hypothetical protein
LRWQRLFYCVLPDSLLDCSSPFAHPRFPLAAAGVVADDPNGSGGGPAALRFSLLVEIFSGDGDGDGDGEVALAAAAAEFTLRDDAGQCGADARCKAAAAAAASAAAAAGCVDMTFDRKALLEVPPP